MPFSHLDRLLTHRRRRRRRQQNEPAESFLSQRSYRQLPVQIIAIKMGAPKLNSVCNREHGRRLQSSSSMASGRSNRAAIKKCHRKQSKGTISELFSFESCAPEVIGDGGGGGSARNVGKSVPLAEAIWASGSAAINKADNCFSFFGFAAKRTN